MRKRKVKCLTGARRLYFHTTYRSSLKSLYSLFLIFKRLYCTEHCTTRIDSNSPNFSSLDLFSSVKNGKKSLHVSATRGDGFRDIGDGCKARNSRPLKACCKYRASVLRSERRTGDARVRFYLTAKIYIQEDKIDVAQQGDNWVEFSDNQDKEVYFKQNFVDFVSVFLVLPVLRSKNKKRSLNQGEI